jgi:hypothetical protein
VISRLAASPNQFISISARQTGYIFSVEQVCLFMAALFAIFAAIYSLWLIPMNHVAALWHFWLSAGGTVLFWVGFFAFARAVESGHSMAARVLAAYLFGFMLLLAGQGVFVANLLVSLIRGRRA